MAWWRRDPSLWARSPIHRYARRHLLREHDEALRNRCFSKTHPAAARHTAQHEQDSDGKERPPGLSNLEWMQLQHYKRWKKRFEEDPYRALFGASEDMLNGKGLRGWEEWAEKMKWPRWMGRDDAEQTGASKNTDGKNAAEKKDDYPKKVRVDGENEHRYHTVKKEHEPMFPEPSIPSSRRFERNLWSNGVESPSDSRRPREILFTAPPASHEARKDTLPPHGDMGTSIPGRALKAANLLDSLSSLHGSVLELEPATNTTKESSKEAAARETSFIEEFLANSGQSKGSSASSIEKTDDWRKTVLDRRAESGVALKPRRRTDVPIVDVGVKAGGPSAAAASLAYERQERESKEEHGKIVPEQAEEQETKAREQSSEGEKVWFKLHGVSGQFPPYGMSGEDLRGARRWGVLLKRSLEAAPNALKDWDLHLERYKALTNDLTKLEGPHNNTPPRRSTAEILDQLPRDDLDFLTAEEIRASMGKRNNTERNRNESRQKLEKEFKDANEQDKELDSMTVAKILNDQHVRRKEWELLDSQEPKKTEEVQEELTSCSPIEAQMLHEKQKRRKEQELLAPQKLKQAKEAQESICPASVLEAHTQHTLDAAKTKETAVKLSLEKSVLETSLDFMSRWLHTGGDVFARNFWQDPVQVLADQKGWLTEDPLFKGIRNGVLKGRRAMDQINDDLLADVPASKALLARLEIDVINVNRPLKTGTYGTDIVADTNEDNGGVTKRVRKIRLGILDTDRDFKKACEAVDGMKRNTQFPGVRKRRMTLAARILQQNAKLTRMMIFGLQARLESAKTEPTEQSKMEELLHRLLALQDTQIALRVLVERAMRVFGIDSPIPVEDAGKGVFAEQANRQPSTVSAETTSPNASEDKPHSISNAAADAKLEDEIKAQKDAMRGLSDDGYARAPKPVARKHFDEPNPLAHSLFRPFGLQLEGLGKESDSLEKEGEVASKENSDRELVKAIKKAYEDMYGPLTVHHQQLGGAEEASTVHDQKSVEFDALAQDTISWEPPEQHQKAEEAREATPPAYQLLKEDDVSPTIPASQPPRAPAEQTTTEGKEAQQGAVETPQKFVPIDSSIRHPEHSVIHGNDMSTGTVPETSTPAPAPEPTPEPDYQILTYDPQTDKVLITMSLPAPPSNTNPPPTPIPLHDALALVNNPSKFIPHLPAGYEVITAKQDMLVLRPSFNPLETHTVRVPVEGVKDDAKDMEGGWKGINPIDGTTRLSPTGYVGDGLELEREFEERRRAAGEQQGRRFESAEKEESAREKKEKRKGGGLARVVRTGIVTAGWCYVVGVVAELMK